MANQVDASTINAGMLFSTNRFVVPIFQRKYSWTVENEVNDFWNDLSNGIEFDSYFLGLIIMTDKDERVIIDGQQRLITMTLLANSIRIVAEEAGNELVAGTMRDMFLFAPNYEKQTREPRLKLTSGADRSVFQSLLYLTPDSQIRGNTTLELAQKFLISKVRDRKNELGRWASFLTNGIQFTQFLHPDINAAFKVYEVVNTRGLDLTPAELLKSYIIGNAAEEERQSIHERWMTIEEQLETAANLTAFVRHAITLKIGYVIPRDLYEKVTETYGNSSDVRGFISYLEGQLPNYLRILTPAIDDSDIEYENRALILLDRLGLRTIRPLFLALLNVKAKRIHYEHVARIILTRLIGGQFGTGAVERAFATAAHTIANGGDILESLSELDQLKPVQVEFERRVRESAHSRATLHALRAAVLQKTSLPKMEGTLHLIRPRYAEWPGFPETDFKSLGNTVGNSILTSVERRPHNTNSLQMVVERLLPIKLPEEKINFDVNSGWSSESVIDQNTWFAIRAGEIFYV